MPSLLSSILKSINREENSKLNILTINHSEHYQFMLAKTGHEFFFLHHPKARAWNESIKDVPNNCHLLSGDNISSQFRRDVDFDLILCQDRESQYNILFQIAGQLSCPIVNVEYSLSSPDANPYYIESLAFQSYNIQVFCDEFVANSWGFETNDDVSKVISHGIDTELFNRWIGGDRKVLTIVDHYQSNNSVTGFDLYKEVMKNFTPNPYGHSPGFSVLPKDTNKLIETYQNASVFLNTSTWKACPLQLLEAMSVGCPIVTTGTANIDEIIEDGVNGYIAEDSEIMKEKLNKVLKDQDLAKSLGQKARQTILDKFNQEMFINSWKQLFETTVGLPSIALTK